ncbi:MAG: Fe-S cluster assembly protein SufB [Candidatus Nanopelagicales bacterium]|nr:Fe-S cluster assembly protein SufB [Candidatus Nanopelagicales bacterium]
MTTSPDDLAGPAAYEYGWSDSDEAGSGARRGLDEDVVRDISAKKNEPDWMLQLRLKGLRLFEKKPLPTWGADLSGINFDSIKYFVRSTEKQAATWEDLPADIKNTYDRLGIPEAEKQRLVAGVAAQYECLAGESRVWTASRGLVPIQDVGLGDGVYTFDERSGRFIVAPVRASQWTGDRQTFKVTAGVRAIRATANHPMLVREIDGPGESADQRLKWRTVESLKVGDLVATPDQGSEDLGFTRVTAIEPFGVEPVFDIEVDGPHNFVAEGLVVHNSEVVYHKIREDLQEQGVIFLDTDTGLREHEDVFKQYFTSVIPAGDNKFAALNTAVWSGGSFVYVPKGVRVEIPLQAYFRINTENMGQFERTLIIVDEGAFVHYVEGCTAPIYSTDSLHSAVVEIIVKDGARCRYTTIQNWSTNVYNLVTKRAIAQRGATMEWVDGNLGSKVTMKYPAVWLTGEHARGETLSIAFAGPGQHQDAGSKMIHAAPNTSSSVVSKSVARGGGRSSYRGLVQMQPNAHGSASTVRCDALLVDDVSRSDTYPYNVVRTDDVSMGHEATVSKVSEDQLFYLRSRGIREDEAMAMIVRGFIEPIARELPMEYALELNRLIELQMEGTVG